MVKIVKGAMILVFLLIANVGTAVEFEDQYTPADKSKDKKAIPVVDVREPKRSIDPKYSKEMEDIKEAAQSVEMKSELTRVRLAYLDREYVAFQERVNTFAADHQAAIYWQDAALVFSGLGAGLALIGGGKYAQPSVILFGGAGLFVLASIIYENIAASALVSPAKPRQ